MLKFAFSTNILFTHFTNDKKKKQVSEWQADLPGITQPLYLTLMVEKGLLGPTQNCLMLGHLSQLGHYRVNGKHLLYLECLLIALLLGHPFLSSLPSTGFLNFRTHFHF